MIGAQNSPPTRSKPNNQVTSALGRLMVVVENCPNLKANENFKQLRYSLEGTENRILQSRARFNTNPVQAYNTDIALFPASFVAALSGYQREDAYFKTKPGARTAPTKVQFTEPESKAFVWVITAESIREQLAQLYRESHGRPDFFVPVDTPVQMNRVNDGRNA